VHFTTFPELKLIMSDEILPPNKGNEVKVVKKRRGKSSFTHRKSGSKGGRPRKSDEIVSTVDDVLGGDTSNLTVR